MVGEPVAYATGSPELKATGADSSRFTNSPITKGSGVKSIAGAHRDDFQGGKDEIATFGIIAANGVGTGIGE